MPFYSMNVMVELMTDLEIDNPSCVLDLADACGHPIAKGLVPFSWLTSCPALHDNEFQDEHTAMRFVINVVEIAKAEVSSSPPPPLLLGLRLCLTFCTPLFCSFGCINLI